MPPCAALALGCWLAANLAAGTLTWGSGVNLPGIAGVLLGLADTVRG